MSKNKLTNITIDFDDCKDEVNLPKVLKDWKANGPMYMLPDGSNVRIPRSGHKVELDDETIVFTLTGFGKLDRPEALHLNEKATEEIKRFMGNAWGLVNLSHKQEAERLIRHIGLEAFMKALKKNYIPGEGRLAALNSTLNSSKAEPEVKADVLSDEQLKAMGLL